MESSQLTTPPGRRPRAGPHRTPIELRRKSRGRPIGNGQPAPDHHDHVDLDIPHPPDWIAIAGIIGAVIAWRSLFVGLIPRIHINKSLAVGCRRRAEMRRSR